MQSGATFIIFSPNLGATTFQNPAYPNGLENKQKKGKKSLIYRDREPTSPPV